LRSTSSAHTTGALFCAHLGTLGSNVGSVQQPGSHVTSVFAAVCRTLASHTHALSRPVNRPAAAAMAAIVDVLRSVTSLSDSECEGPWPIRADSSR